MSGFVHGVGLMCVHSSRYLLITCLCFVLSACGGGSGSLSTTDFETPAPVTSPSTPVVSYEYQVPENINDGWQVNDAEIAGANVQIIETAINRMLAQDFGFRRIDGIAIAKNGELILDHRIRTELDRADGWAGNQDIDLHIVNSVTKSVMSLTMGIAIEQGLIPGVNVLVHDYLSVNNNIANWGQRKASITLQDYLTMRHGYDWNEWNVNYLTPENQNTQMLNHEDPMQYLLDLPMATEPGTTFAYSTGVTYALGIMVSQASGQSLFDFMDQNLFQPLNIGKTDFWTLEGQLHAGSALYLTQRDMLKIGQMVLDKGIWNGQRIVSEQWIDESTQQRFVTDPSINQTYGYLWWGSDYDVESTPVRTYRAIEARGFGGQFILIFEELNVVVVLTGHRYEDGQVGQTNTRMIMENYLLPALR